MSAHATGSADQVEKRRVDRLETRERRVLELRFGLDRGEARTLEEVSEHFDLTRERIRQIEQRAMAKLRHPSLASDIVGAILV